MTETTITPAQVRIGPYLYHIVVDQAEIGQARYDADQASLVGQIQYNHGRIIIDPQSAPSRQQETLLHEILHGVWSFVDLKDGDGESSAEAIIKRLAPALLDTLRRNPDVLAYLLAMGK